MSADPETVSILAGGWSAACYDRTRLPGRVIGVNDAAILAPAHYAVSMDRLWAENRLEALLKTPGPQGVPPLAYVRINALQNLPELARKVIPFENDNTSADMAEGEPLGKGPGPDVRRLPKVRLNGGNSGLCAVNLAYQLRPRRLILFGFDMNRDKDGNPYWYPPYPWAKPTGSTGAGTYRAWAAEFAIVAGQMARAGIEVLNASPSSAIEAFPKVDPRSVLA